MSAPHPLPLALATLSSLPELAPVLAGIAPEATGGYDSVEVMRAAQRQRNLAAAALYTWVVEVAVRRPGSAHTVERLQIPHEYAVDEIRAALGLSATAAGKLLSVAWEAVKRLPQIQIAQVGNDVWTERVDYM